MESRGTALRHRDRDENSGTTTPVSYDNVGSRMDSPNSNMHFTAPGTPNLYPVMSLSSSIASLDALSVSGRTSVPQSPATMVRQVLTETGPTSATLGESAGGESTIPFRNVQDEEPDQYEEVSIGKGLALYNSVEIDRLKGVKRYVLRVNLISRNEMTLNPLLLSL
jgi:hypothetical protein